MEKYYSLKGIKKLNCEYNILLGERANGKSYSVKDEVLKNAWQNKEEFIYLRRWKEDIRRVSIVNYFADMDIKKYTRGCYDSIEVYQSEIFFSTLQPDGKKKRGMRIGHAIPLTGETHFKSQLFPRVTTVIFEEFITDSGYLRNEPDTLMSLVSTVFRRRIGRVFLIGNTISRVCPYFSAWQLENVPRQKQGTIEVYKYNTLRTDENGELVIINIAVEYCESSSNSSMIFGSTSSMAVGGAWQTEKHNTFSEPLEHLKKYYHVLIQRDNFKFSVYIVTGKENVPYLAVHPYTKKIEIKNFDRIFSDRLYLTPAYSESLVPITKYDTLFFKLLNEGKIQFSDNLTGTEFYRILKERGGIHG